MLTHEDDGMMGQFIVVDSTTGVNELASSLDQNFSIFPNPVFSRKLNIKWNGAAIKYGSFAVIDMKGQEVFLKFVDITQGKEKQIDIGNIAAGIYTIRLKTPSGYYYQKLIVMD